MATPIQRNGSARAVPAPITVGTSRPEVVGLAEQYAARRKAEDEYCAAVRARLREDKAPDEIPIINHDEEE